MLNVRQNATLCTGRKKLRKTLHRTLGAGPDSGQDAAAIKHTEATEDAGFTGGR